MAKWGISKRGKKYYNLRDGDGQFTDDGVANLSDSAQNALGKSLKKNSGWRVTKAGNLSSGNGRLPSSKVTSGPTSRTTDGLNRNPRAEEAERTRRVAREIAGSSKADKPEVAGQRKMHSGLNNQGLDRLLVSDAQNDKKFRERVGKMSPAEVREAAERLDSYMDNMPERMDETKLMIAREKLAKESNRRDKYGLTAAERSAQGDNAVRPKRAPGKSELLGKNPPAEMSGSQFADLIEWDSSEGLRKEQLKNLYETMYKKSPQSDRDRVTGLEDKGARPATPEEKLRLTQQGFLPPGGDLDRARAAEQRAKDADWLDWSTSTGTARERKAEAFQKKYGESPFDTPGKEESGNARMMRQSAERQAARDKRDAEEAAAGNPLFADHPAYKPPVVEGKDARSMTAAEKLEAGRQMFGDKGVASQKGAAALDHRASLEQMLANTPDHRKMDAINRAVVNATTPENRAIAKKLQQELVEERKGNTQGSKPSESPWIKPKQSQGDKPSEKPWIAGERKPDATATEVSHAVNSLLRTTRSMGPVERQRFYDEAATNGSTPAVQTAALKMGGRYNPEFDPNMAPQIAEAQKARRAEAEGRINPYETSQEERIAHAGVTDRQWAEVQEWNNRFGREKNNYAEGYKREYGENPSQTLRRVDEGEGPILKPAKSGPPKASAEQIAELERDIDIHQMIVDDPEADRQDKARARRIIKESKESLKANGAAAPRTPDLTLNDAAQKRRENDANISRGLDELGKRMKENQRKAGVSDALLEEIDYIKTNTYGSQRINAEKRYEERHGETPDQTVDRIRDGKSKLEADRPNQPLEGATKPKLGVKSRPTVDYGPDYANQTPAQQKSYRAKRRKLIDAAVEAGLPNSEIQTIFARRMETWPTAEQLKRRR